jgi:peptide/nickel transport system permease protein
MRGRPPALVIGAFLVGVTVFLALLSYVWTPFDPIRVDASIRLLPPMSGAHVLGTDPLCRDILSQIIVGARTTLFVGMIAVAIALIAGIPLGGVAAVRGGAVGEAVMRWIDIMYAFPAVLMAIMLSAALKPSTTTAMVAIGIAYTPVFARVTRAASLQILSKDYIAAARGYGRGSAYIFVRHVLPNISSLLIVQITISFALAILAEAALSYLGLGTQPPTPSWGRMLKEAQTFLALTPNLALWPGLAIAMTVFGFNLLGDGVRDQLDPTLRRVRPES